MNHSLLVTLAFLSVQVFKIFAAATVVLQVPSRFQPVLLPFELSFVSIRQVFCPYVQVRLLSLRLFGLWPAVVCLLSRLKLITTLAPF